MFLASSSTSQVYVLTILSAEYIYCIKVNLFHIKFSLVNDSYIYFVCFILYPIVGL